MTKYRGCWDVSRNRRTHYIRSIDGQGWATISEGLVCAVGELSGVVLWVCIQLDTRQTRPSLRERVGDRVRGEDGVDTLKGNGGAKDLDHLLNPRKNVVGAKLIEG